MTTPTRAQIGRALVAKVTPAGRTSATANWPGGSFRGAAIRNTLPTILMPLISFRAPRKAVQKRHAGLDQQLRTVAGPAMNLQRLETVRSDQVAAANQTRAV
jgi:hypothetical protein